MDLPFCIDVRSPDSLTRQVSDGLHRAISTGFFRVGDVLPPRDRLSKALGVSEYVVRAALRELSSERLVVGRPHQGYRVVANSAIRRQKLVLDISTESLGSYCSRVSTAECMRTLVKGGCQVVPVILGVDSQHTTYLKPLVEALSRSPDLAFVRVTSSRRSLVAEPLARAGCPYATVTLGKGKPASGRFVGNLHLCVEPALTDMVKASLDSGVKSVLQIDFGPDTYANVEPFFRRRGISVERFSVNVTGRDSLDAIARAACSQVERLLSRSNLPDMIYAADDYLAVGVLEAVRRKRLSVPRDIRLCVYSNAGSGLFPFGDVARVEFDPRADGREIGRCLLQWLETGTLGAYRNPHVFRPEGCVIG